MITWVDKKYRPLPYGTEIFNHFLIEDYGGEDFYMDKMPESTKKEYKYTSNSSWKIVIKIIFWWKIVMEYMHSFCSNTHHHELFEDFFYSYQHMLNQPDPMWKLHFKY